MVVTQENRRLAFDLPSRISPRAPLKELFINSLFLSKLLIHNNTVARVGLMFQPHWSMGDPCLVNDGARGSNVYLESC